MVQFNTTVSGTGIILLRNTAFNMHACEKPDVLQHADIVGIMQSILLLNDYGVRDYDE